MTPTWLDVLDMSRSKVFTHISSLCFVSVPLELCLQDLAFWMGKCHCSSNLTTQTNAFNVQCTLKSLLQKLYDSALQCNFCIKTFYHNRIINSNLFIFPPHTHKLVFSQNSKYLYPLLIVQRENNNKDGHAFICPQVKLCMGHGERPS